MAAIESGDVVVANSGVIRQDHRNRHSIKGSLSVPSIETKDGIDALDKNLWTH